MLLESFQLVNDKTIRRIGVSFRADRTLEECKTMPDYKKYVEPYLCGGVSVSSVRNYDSWNGAIKANDLLRGMKIKNANFLKILPCSRLFVVQCASNGDLRLCGCRYNPFVNEHELFLGNIKNHTILEVYSSLKTRRIFNSFFMNKLPEICKKCSWYDTF